MAAPVLPPAQPCDAGSASAGTTRPTVTYHCVLADGARRLLLLPAGPRLWALPAVSGGSGRWLPNEVGAIRRLVAERLGADASVLRHLLDAGENQVCELQLHQTDWVPPQASRWIDRTDLDDIQLATEGHRPILQRWLDEGTRVAPTHPRAPWERPGWLALAIAWIHARLDALGSPPLGPIEPVKMAWSGSAVLTVSTAAGRVFFKAMRPGAFDELSLVLALAERRPGCLPRILASDRRRRWLLTSDFAPARVLDVLPRRAWLAAARRFGELQASVAAEPERWAPLAGPRRTGAELADGWARLLRDRDRLVDLSPGLDRARLDALDSLDCAVRDHCQQLDASGIPLSLHLEDLRGANIAADSRRVLFFDWGDCAWAHPFFSIQRWLDFVAAPSGARRWDPRLDHPDDAGRRRLRDAYLEPWRDVAPRAMLHDAFALTATLNELYQVIRCHAEAERVEPGSPWHHRVRHALAAHLSTLASPTGPFARPRQA